MPSMIQLRHVVKIFGDEPRGEALNMLKAGYSKDEIQEHTGHVVGVDDADFDVEAGEIFVVMGLSGSGKSTLIRCVNRLVEPTAGEVIVDGIDVTALEPRQLKSFAATKPAWCFNTSGCSRIKACCPMWHSVSRSKACTLTNAKEQPKRH